jgi:hypothetical protein
VSVVPALIEIGEVTVLPFAGEQIVTVGEAGLSWHEGAAWAEIAKQKTKNRRLTLNGMGTQGFGRNRHHHTFMGAGIVRGRLKIQSCPIFTGKIWRREAQA